MIKWFKRNQGTVVSEIMPLEPVSSLTDTLLVNEDKTIDGPVKQGFFNRFKQGLSKTRHQLGDNIGRLLLGKKEIDATVFETLEELLLRADLGIETTKVVLKQLTEGLDRRQLADGDAVFAALKTRLENILTINTSPLLLSTGNNMPFVILMVGVNGAGKTTTIGKLAKLYQQRGKKVMLAAGDTFRAAAVEQLQVWGERNQIPVIAQHTGADSASVNLMDELKKVKRVIQNIDPNAPHEIMLVLDAGIGQNALNQARQFHQVMGLTGITMTKLDGTAKGGILFAIANELKLPFRYLGIGEGLDDLQPFDASQFVNVIFSNDHS